MGKYTNIQKRIKSFGYVCDPFRKNKNIISDIRFEIISNKNEEKNNNVLCFYTFVLFHRRIFEMKFFTIYQRLKLIEAE